MSLVLTAGTVACSTRHVIETPLATRADVATQLMKDAKSEKKYQERFGIENGLKAAVAIHFATAIIAESKSPKDFAMQWTGAVEIFLVRISSHKRIGDRLSTSGVNTWHDAYKFVWRIIDDNCTPSAES